MTVLKLLLLVIIGLSGGLAVGAGLVAFITVLGIVPRLAQVTNTKQSIPIYQYGLITGTLFWTWTGLRDAIFFLPKDLLLVLGLLAGMFIGMLAAALTEVLNVLPIIAKRIRMTGKLTWLIMAMVFGKVLGSLFYWIFFVS